MSEAAVESPQVYIIPEDSAMDADGEVFAHSGSDTSNTARNAETSASAADDSLMEGVVGYKKTRRGRRGGNKQREWKPYSKMTWEERAAREKKEEERVLSQIQQEREAARIVPSDETGSTGKRKRSKKKRTSVACPPAPRNTTAFLIAEHSYDMPSPTPMPATPYAMPSPGVKAPYGFDSDYEAAVFGELEDMSKDELIAALKKAYTELDDLRSDTRKQSLDDSALLETVRAENMALRDEIAMLREQLARMQSHTS